MMGFPGVHMHEAHSACFDASVACWESMDMGAACRVNCSEGMG